MSWHWFKAAVMLCRSRWNGRDSSLTFRMDLTLLSSGVPGEQSPLSMCNPPPPSPFSQVVPNIESIGESESHQLSFTTPPNEQSTTAATVGLSSICFANRACFLACATFIDASRSNPSWRSEWSVSRPVRWHVWQCLSGISDGCETFLLIFLLRSYEEKKEAELHAEGHEERKKLLSHRKFLI